MLRKKASWENLSAKTWYVIFCCISSFGYFKNQFRNAGFDFRIKFHALFCLFFNIYIMRPYLDKYPYVVFHRYRTVANVFWPIFSKNWHLLICLDCMTVLWPYQRWLLSWGYLLSRMVPLMKGFRIRFFRPKSNIFLAVYEWWWKKFMIRTYWVCCLSAWHVIWCTRKLV